MRTLLYICLLVTTTLSAAAQRISYDPPANLPQQIGEADYKHIVDSSIATVRTRYKVEGVQAGSIHIRDAKGMTPTVNLDNLIVECLSVDDRKAWDPIIHEHFRKLFSTMDEQRSLDPTSYETMKKYLSIR